MTTELWEPHEEEARKNHGGNVLRMVLTGLASSMSMLRIKMNGESKGATG